MFGERGKVAAFASANPVFNRQLWRQQLFPGQPSSSADSLLTYHVKAGAFVHAGPGVYASVPPHMSSDTFVPDRELVAAMIRSDGVLSYHTALELHGLNYSEGSETILISEGRPATYETRVGTVRFVVQPAPLKGLPTERLGLKTIEHRGLTMQVTGVERTIVDCMDRHSLAGGLEELAHALMNVTVVDAPKLVSLVADRRNKSLAGLVGWWLEQSKDRLMVADVCLEQMHRLAPRTVHPVLGVHADEGVVSREWNIRIPSLVASPEFEDVSDMRFV